MTQQTGGRLTGEERYDEPQDAVFDALAHSRRRTLLQYLLTADTPVTLDEVTAELSSQEGPSAVAGQSTDSVDAIKASLIHGHMPKLAMAGLIEYDPDGQTIALADRTDEAQRYLEAMPDE